MGVTCRAKDLAPFIVMEMLDRAKELEARGRKIVHFEAGEPDFDTPEVIREAAVKAIRDGQTHYTPVAGIPQLREAIAQRLFERYGAKVDPGQVIITAGTSPALLLLFTALLEHGQKVIISDPAYPCYKNTVCFTGGQPVLLPVAESQGFALNPAEVEAKLDPSVKAVMLNSPSNPTGQVLAPERLAELARLVPGNPGGPYLVSDEIYHGLVYEGREHSVLEYTDNAFVLGGFSKYYAMTGWRLGYMVVPKHFARPLLKMHANFAICAPSVAQWAGVTALTDPEAETAAQAMVAQYDRRRRRLIAGLKDLGFSLPVEPTGAFYMLLGCGHLNPDDLALADDILEKVEVAVTPGRDFGPSGQGFLRFSYTSSLEDIELGLERLKQYRERHCS